MAEEQVPVMLAFHEKRMRPIVARAIPTMGRLLEMQRNIGFIMPGINKTMNDFFVMAFPYAGPIGITKTGVINQEGDFFCLVEKSAYAAFEREELSLGQVLAESLNVVCVEHKLVDNKVSIMVRSQSTGTILRMFFLGSTTFDMGVILTQLLLNLDAPTREAAARDAAEAELKRIMGKREA